MLRWLKSGRRARKPTRARGLYSEGATVAIDVIQEGNSVVLKGEGVEFTYAVEGIELPPAVDASFAAWGVLPVAMARGINIRLNQPIDPQVAANATRVSQIWEMWVPGLYRSINISGTGEWSPRERSRRSPLQLYSGGVDSTFSLLRQSDAKLRGCVLTVFGLDYRRKETRFDELIAKTDPLLEQLNFDRVVVRTNASQRPQGLTHGFTLAGCAFLLSDLFAGAILPADRTYAQDMLTFPWGTNHVTNSYLAGSDFAVETRCAELSRAEKLALISRDAWPYLSFCRKEAVLPANCGRCNKCVRTKAMFLAATGAIPELFIDNEFDETLMLELPLTGRESTHILDLYVFAKDRGVVDQIPGLPLLVEECRRLSAMRRRGHDD